MATRKRYPSETYRNCSEERKALLRERTRTWRYKDPSRGLWMNIKNRAKARNIPFNIEPSDIIFPEFCPVLGLKLKVGPGRLCANSPSLDRIFPELGYVKGNVIVISNKANMIKSNATPEEIARVAEFFKRLYEEQSETAQAA